MNKPHKGIIVGIRRDVPGAKEYVGYEKNLGYIVAGRFVDHPNFGGSPGYTSLIVKKSRWSKIGDDGYRTCEVETLNSRYTWKST